LRASVVIIMVLIVASWVFILQNDRTQAASFFSVDTVRRAWTFVKELLGIGTGATPAFAKGSEWRDAGSLACQTLAMSVMGIAISAAVALLTFMFGAHNLMLGELAPYGSRLWRLGFFVTRAFFILTRGVPELLWAMIVVFLFSPGILPGAIALGIHNSGILGKLSSEVVEGLDPRPIRSLRSAGAGRFQVLFYGVLPQALPRFITYAFYRWEVIIRTTVVVGFVAAGGLGTEFRLAMSHFQYTTVTLLLIWYLILVVAVDLAAAYFRRAAGESRSGP
jgi:phosphonate transport system permease protein